MAILAASTKMTNYTAFMSASYIYEAKVYDTAQFYWIMSFIILFVEIRYALATEIPTAVLKY